MAHQIALLLPHLGGKAYSLRSAIVHAIGSLLHKAFDRLGCEGLRQSRSNFCTCARPEDTFMHLKLLSHVRCRSNAVVEAADAQGAQARLRSKQLLLDMLEERIRYAGPLGMHLGVVCTAVVLYRSYRC